MTDTLARIANSKAHRLGLRTDALEDTLATIPGPFANDAAAATAGVAVGEAYWKGTKLAVRMT